MAIAVTGAPIIVSLTVGPGNGSGGGGTDPDPPIVTPVTDPALTLSSPQPGAVVTSTKPTFVVAVITTKDESYTLDVQYDDNNGFTHPTTVSVDIDASDGGAFLPASTPAPATTYWRAQIRQGTTVVVAYTAAQSFTVDTTITASSLPVTWTADPAASAVIHLWHLNPPAALAGDTVTAFGQGFGPATGAHVLFGLDTITATSWTLVPASDALGTAGRRIGGGSADCEHYEVVFTAPATDGPGDAITVEAN